MASRIVNMNISDTLIREADRVAKQEGRTRSELFREAVRRYIHAAQHPAKDSRLLLSRLEAMASEGSKFSAARTDKVVYRKDW